MTGIAKLVSWVAGTLGALLILAGVIGFFVQGCFLGVSNFYNWFYFANSFLLLAICSQLYVMASDIKNRINT